MRKIDSNPFLYFAEVCIYLESTDVIQFCGLMSSLCCAHENSRI